MNHVDSLVSLFYVFPKITKLITEKIQTRSEKKEHWRHHKKNIDDEVSELLELKPEWGLRAYDLYTFDIDGPNGLILLNYSKQAHAILHKIDGGQGWTTPLRMMRGVVLDWRLEKPRFISRGFEKFFNINELPETSIATLSKEKRSTWAGMELTLTDTFKCRSKEDGAMIEYFVHNENLIATTRGFFNTLYVDAALELFSYSDFQLAKNVCNNHKVNLANIVVELICPLSKVYVDYGNEKKLYLLAAYDISGKKIKDDIVSEIAGATRALGMTLPLVSYKTVNELWLECQDREVKNQEGWVMDLNDTLIKFKYINYIGQMVMGKLSYRYVMQTMMNGTSDKMFHTLSEEIRPIAYSMIDDVIRITKNADDYKLLYALYSDLEKGENSYRTVCRSFWKKMSNDIKLDKDLAYQEMNRKAYTLCADSLHEHMLQAQTE